MQESSVSGLASEYILGVRPIDFLRNSLMAPFDGKLGVFDSTSLRVEVAQPSSLEREMAADLVNYAYNLRYGISGGNIEDLAHDEFDQYDNTHTIVAKGKINDESVILGTLRVVCDGREGSLKPEEQLEVFKLFDMEEGGVWPHQASGTIPGELSRFSLHPIFDAIASDPDMSIAMHSKVYKRTVLRELWPKAIDIMKKEGVGTPYFILTPKIHSFVVSAGIPPIEVAGSIPSPSDYSQSIRNRFSPYWQPEVGLDEQPAVYIAPWKMTGVI